MQRVALFAALIAAPFFAHAQALPAVPQGYVTDAAQVLSADTRALLETRLATLDASTTEQIAVVTVPSLEGDYIEHYATQLFEKWGIGEAKKDTGVLLLLAIAERELRIEVGYGLEGALPDSVADRIIRNDMTPLLKEGNYDGAVIAGVESIIAAIQGEYVAPPQVDAGSIDPMALVAFGIFALQWVAAILGRTKSWWLGGIIGGAIGVVVSSFFGWWIMGGAILTLNLFIFGLVFDYLVSSTFKDAISHGSNPPWWTGGGGFGGSSHSGGFGGFGGGMSGGGGASGRW
ncbi:MAG: hypothetical protein RLZZ342_608 [Candidatus Parcubacteria bacterium]